MGVSEQHTVIMKKIPEQDRCKSWYVLKDMEEKFQLSQDSQSQLEI